MLNRLFYLCYTIILTVVKEHVPSMFSCKTRWLNYGKAHFKNALCICTCLVQMRNILAQMGTAWLFLGVPCLVPGGEFFFPSALLCFSWRGWITSVFTCETEGRKSQEFQAAPRGGLALRCVCSAPGRDSFPFFRSCSIPNSCFLELMPSRCKIPSERGFPQCQMDRRGNGIHGHSEGPSQRAQSKAGGPAGRAGLDT